jgi:hypothetical protein
MSLDRLIRRERPDNLFYATIEQLDAQNRRLLVLGPNNKSLWAAYSAEDFPDLEEGQAVAIGITAGTAFLIRAVTAAMPTDTYLLVV